MDSNGYPDEIELQHIRDWDYTDPYGLMEFIEDFLEGYGTINQQGVLFEVSTGGWNGNESIIRAMQENVMFWGIYWESSRAGGHYEFILPKDKLTTIKKGTE